MKKNANSQEHSTPSLTGCQEAGTIKCSGWTGSGAGSSEGASSRGGSAIIFCAPSGSGKSTIINSLMPHEELNLAFSVSATTRPPRGQEQHGVEYLFMSPEEFREHIAADDFIEYEEVYEDRYYGTLKAQVEKQLAEGQNVIFDVDVHGGMRLKDYFGDRALSLFIQPPSIEELRRRLEGRGTDAPEVIQQRLDRAAYELSFAPRFDQIVVNDNLETAKADAYTVICDFLGPTPHPPL